MAVVFKIACLVLAFMVVAAPYAAEGVLTCDTIDSAMEPCRGYVIDGTAFALAPGCCLAFTGLYELGMVATTPDRQAACHCGKNTFNAMTDAQKARAAALPGKCGVTIPDGISPQTDCSEVV